MDRSQLLEAELELERSRSSRMRRGLVQEEYLDDEACFLRGTQAARGVKGYGEPPGLARNFRGTMYTSTSTTFSEDDNADFYETRGFMASGGAARRTTLAMVKPLYRPGKLARLNHVDTSAPRLPGAIVSRLTPQYRIDRKALRSYSLPPSTVDASVRRRGPGVGVGVGDEDDEDDDDDDESSTQGDDVEVDNDGDGANEVDIVVDKASDNIDANFLHRHEQWKRIPRHVAEVDAASAAVASSSSRSSLGVPITSPGHRVNARAEIFSDLRTGIETVWYFIRQNEMLAMRRACGRNGQGRAGEAETGEAIPEEEVNHQRSRQQHLLEETSEKGTHNQKGVASSSSDLETDTAENDEKPDCDKVIDDDMHYAQYLMEPGDATVVGDIDVGDSIRAPLDDINDAESFIEEEESSLNRHTSDDFIQKTPIVICQLATSPPAGSVIPGSFHEALRTPAAADALVSTSQGAQGYVYDPYNLVVVKEPRRDAPYYVISPRGVLTMSHTGEPSEVTGLTQWLLEKQQFTMLRTIRFFTLFGLRRVFMSWRSNVRFYRNTKNKHALAKRLILCDIEYRALVMSTFSFLAKLEEKNGSFHDRFRVQAGRAGVLIESSAPTTTPDGEDNNGEAVDGETTAPSAPSTTNAITTTTVGKAADTVNDIDTYVRDNIGRIEDIMHSMQREVEHLVSQVESFADLLRDQLSTDGDEAMYASTTDGGSGDTQQQMHQQWRYVSVSAQSDMMTQKANRRRQARDRQQMLKRLSRLLDLMFAGSIHIIAGSELREFMDRLDILKHGHILFAVTVCFDSYTRNSGTDNWGHEDTVVREGSEEDDDNSNDPTSVGYRLDPAIYDIQSALLTIPRTLRASLLRVPYVSLTTSAANTSNYCVFNRAERDDVKLGRKMFEEALRMLIPLEEVECAVETEFRANSIAIARRVLFICVRNFYRSHPFIEHLKETSRAIASEEESRLERKRRNRQHRLSDGYVAKIPADSIARVAAARASATGQPNAVAGTSTREDRRGGGVTAVQEPRRIIMTEEGVAAVLHLRKLYTVLATTKTSDESCRLLDINAAPLKEEHLPRLAMLKQEVDTILCAALLQACKDINTLLFGYSCSFKTLLDAFVRQQMVMSATQPGSPGGRAEKDGSGSGGGEKGNEDERNQRKLDSIADLLSYIMLHRPGGELSDNIASALANLKKLEFLVVNEFASSTKTSSAPVTGLGVLSGSGSSRLGGVSMLSLDIRERQLLLERQQQQQRKETYTLITGALREVEECKQRYIADFTVAEECIVKNKSSIDGGLTDTARSIRKDLVDIIESCSFGGGNSDGSKGDCHTVDSSESSSSGDRDSSSCTNKPMIILARTGANEQVATLERLASLVSLARSRLEECEVIQESSRKKSDSSTSSSRAEVEIDSADVGTITESEATLSELRVLLTRADAHVVCRRTYFESLGRWQRFVRRVTAETIFPIRDNTVNCDELDAAVRAMERANAELAAFEQKNHHYGLDEHLRDVKEDVSMWRRILPLIKVLCSSIFCQRHWSTLLHTMGIANGYGTPNGRSSSGTIASGSMVDDKSGKGGPSSSTSSSSTSFVRKGSSSNLRAATIVETSRRHGALVSANEDESIALTVGDLLAGNLLAQHELVESLRYTASQEASLLSRLQMINTKVDKLRFKFSKFSVNAVSRVENLQDIFEVLELCQGELAILNGSPHVSGVESIIKETHSRFVSMLKQLEALRECTSLWHFLYGTFFKIESNRRRYPGIATTVDLLHTEFVQLMLALESVPVLVVAAKSEAVSAAANPAAVASGASATKRSDAKDTSSSPSVLVAGETKSQVGGSAASSGEVGCLTQCASLHQKFKHNLHYLSEDLEDFRQHFPRLYFVSDLDLISSICCESPENINPTIMSTCLTGAVRVKTEHRNDDLQITSVCSGSGEIVQLSQHVASGAAQNLARWMGTLLDTLVLTLREVRT